MRWLALTALVTATIPAVANSEPLSALFSQVGDFPVGAGTSRTDYESIDAKARRLYIAKMGAGELLVFDIDRNTLIASLGGFPKVTGVLVVPELHKIYASVPGAGLIPSLFVGLGMAGLSSGRGMVAIVDTNALKENARVPGGVFPDGIAYDPSDRRIFVSDELGSAVTVIDALADRVIARINTGGEVGNVRYDPVSGMVYVPVQSKNEVIAIDPRRAVVTARRPLTGGEHPHGFIPVPRAAIAYAACDEDDRLVTIDLATGRTFGSVPVAHDPDVLAIDGESERLYVAAESGNLSVYDITTPMAPKWVGDVFVGDGAHAVAVDPISHRLYFALADVNGRSIVRVLSPKKW